ncbi:Probable arginine--tRNA ligase, cytoplasmic; AltName: Full=Arginyl-tRNA synthetase; Short=ArgRS [Serendipita indica DSM 11827]|nr:Probable arginine--tRNA ligase, cytoplasmic; AltName: Full=Arginyl-tRNA synthetase; Short=ArgRS [Serendipita indica DSM 11827]
MSTPPPTNPPIIQGQLPAIAGTEPHRCVMDAFRTAIASQISRVFPSIPLEKAYEGVDYSKKDSDFTVALMRFKLGGKPADHGARFKEAFVADEWVESVDVNGGFLTFKCHSENLARQILGQVDELTNKTSSGQGEYGHSDVGKGKKVLIEYSSPNIAKEFHVGHLRSTIIGAFLTNLYKACGHEVVSLNYLGDWGKQFGLIAVGYEKYGDEAEMERDPIKHLYNVYVKINQDLKAEKEELEKKAPKPEQADPSAAAATSKPDDLEKEEESQVDAAARAYFKRMESGDEESLVNWRKWRKYSIEQYEQQYKTLNVQFDEYLGESMVSYARQLEMVKQLEDMGLVSDSKGAKLVDLEQWKLGKAILLKKDGTTMYLTRDIIGAIERWEKYHFDKMIYVVASQQDLHLAQFFKILSLMGFEWAPRLEHINYGLVTGMSTRKGTAVFLNQIIKESADVMMEQMMKNEEKFKQIEDPEYVAREVGITAIKVQDMQAKRINNYAFNWSRMTSFEGDTGPYLQYAHVRLSSIERKNPDLMPLPDLSSINFAHLTEPKARDIIFQLGMYPDAVRTALKTREPSGIITYAMKLAHSISSAWDVLLVKGESDREKAKARMWLFLLARAVLGAAMRLLSLTPLERM